jgi:hypothetical protein
VRDELTRFPHGAGSWVNAFVRPSGASEAVFVIGGEFGHDGRNFPAFESEIAQHVIVEFPQGPIDRSRVLSLPEMRPGSMRRGERCQGSRRHATDHA